MTMVGRLTAARWTSVAVMFACVASLIVTSVGVERAVAGPPPGMNTLFFSPSASGGCGNGQISAVGEASAPAQSGAGVFGVTNPTSEVYFPLNQPPVATRGPAAGLYAAGMASTAWNYSFGYPWAPTGPLAPGGTAAAWSTLVYFTNSCGGTQQWLYAACYAAWPQVMPDQAPLIGCPKAQEPGVMAPPESTGPWVAFNSPLNPPEGDATEWVGSGLTIDATRGILYFATVPAGCAGSKTCQVSIWSAAVATTWGGTLAPTLVAQLPNSLNPSYMAVDPVTNVLFLLGANPRQVISVPTSGGGSPSVLLSGGSLISGGVSGLAVDPATAMVYVLSGESGNEPNQIAQVPEDGCCATSLFSGDAVADSGPAFGLAVDPANGVAMWADSAAGNASGTANQILWGPLDGSPSSGAAATTYGWAGAPGASYAANIRALTLAGGVGACDYEGNSFTCPTTTVAAAGARTRAARSGASVAIRLRAFMQAMPGSTPSAAASGSSAATSSGITGPMVVTFRSHRTGRVYGTLRPGFSIRANTQRRRQVAVPVGARSALRRGDLDVQVRTRRAGAGQRWRTRVLRVLPGG